MIKKWAQQVSLLWSIILNIEINSPQENDKVRILWAGKMLMQIEINMKGQEVNFTQVLSEGYFKALNIKMACKFALKV